MKSREKEPKMDWKKLIGMTVVTAGLFIIIIQDPLIFLGLALVGGGIMGYIKGL